MDVLTWIYGDRPVREQRSTPGRVRR